MNPSENVKYNPQIFRCKKDEYGSTKAHLLDDLFKDQDKYNLFDDLGALNVQKELIKKFREYNEEKIRLNKQIENLESKINNIIGAVRCVVFTEDSDIDLLKSILKASSFKMEETEVRTYEGCTNLIAAKTLSLFIKEKFPELVVLIHLDRDYKTDEEITELQNKFSALNILTFVTTGTDVESHFIKAEHIHKHHPEISVQKANELITEIDQTLFSEATVLLRTKNFGEKHKTKKSHFDSILDDLPKSEPRKYVKGKSVYKLLKQKIKDNTTNKTNSKIHEFSEHLKDSSLEIISKNIWE